MKAVQAVADEVIAEAEGAHDLGFSNWAIQGGLIDLLIDLA